MKYLKVYESPQVDTTGYMHDLKKYVVWEMPSVWYIFETHRIIFKNITFKRLYAYYPTLVSRVTGKLGEIEEMPNDLYTFTNDQVKKHMILESDDLNDCLNFDLLSTLKDANKFNL